jgi:hypothetical protein
MARRPTQADQSTSITTHSPTARHAGVTATMQTTKRIEQGLRFDIVVNLPWRYGYQWILNVELRISSLLCHPYGVQTVPTDAAGQMCMKLSRGISSCERKSERSWQNQGGWRHTSILGSRLVKAMSTGPSAVMAGMREHSGIGGVTEVSRSDNGR